MHLHLQVKHSASVHQSHSNLKWLLSIMLASHIHLALVQHVQLTSCGLEDSDECLPRQFSGWRLLRSWRGLPAWQQNLVGRCTAISATHRLLT